VLGEDWRLEVMKTLDRQKVFPKDFQNFFQANIKKKKTRCFLPMVL